MGPRKYRVRSDAGKKVVTKVERISIKSAMEQAALSVRGKSWATLRADIARILGDKTRPITSSETVAIECKVDGREPSQEEIKSMETSINKWLADDVKSPVRIRYIETMGKILLLPEEQITALFGKRAGRPSNE